MYKLDAIKMLDEYYLSLKELYDSKSIDWQETEDRHQIQVSLLRAEVYSTTVNIIDTEEDSSI